MATIFEAILDGTNLGPVVSPLDLTGLAPGVHTLQVYEFDTVSGLQSATSSYTWTIDPITGGGPGSGTYSKNVVLPNGAGANKILVRATDTQVPPLTTTVTRNVTVSLVGTQPPSISILQPTDGSTVFSVNQFVQAQVTPGTNPIATVQTTLDGSTFTNLVLNSSTGFYEATILIPADSSSQITAVVTDNTGLQGFDAAIVVESSQAPVVTQLRAAQIIAPTKTVIAKWELRIFDHDGNLVGKTDANPSFGRFLNAVGYMNCDLNLHDNLSKKIRVSPDLHDWGVYRNGVKIEGGRITTAGLTTDTRVLSLTGDTWLGYLAQRTMPFDPSKPLNFVTKLNSSAVTQTNVVSLTYSNVDLFDVVRSLINYVFSDGNAIPLTFDFNDSGIVQTLNFDASDGSDLLSRITDLANQAQGFDFEISPDCNLTMYAPQKGTYSLYRLNLQRNVHAIPAYTNAGIKANRLTVNGSGQGGSSSRATVVVEDTVSQQTRRIIDAAVDVGTVSSRSVLSRMAQSDLVLATQEQVTFQVVVLTQGRNLWELVSPGDYVWVDADLEYDEVGAYYRCLSMEGEITEQGDEYVTFSFGPSSTNF
jgi:hypothetical protein